MDVVPDQTQMAVVPNFPFFFRQNELKKTILGFLWIVSHDFSGITAISSELQRASPGNRAAA